MKTALVAPEAPNNSGRLIELTVGENLSVNFYVNGWITAAVLVVLIGLLVWQILQYRGHFKSFEIDQAEIGIGQQKFKLAPNDTDRQIAYKIWVELSTRKIGLAIDLQYDVVEEVYDSWHTFFGITRELIKDVPVRKFRRPATEKIVGMSIEVLNEGLRPHLTMWQARFRRWYERQAKQEDFALKTPQEIQQEFPAFKELSQDLLLVNKKLIAYRAKMRQLVG